MNTIYKSKWNESTCTWVACSELVRGKTKNNCIKIAAAIALALTSISSYAADAVPCQHDDNPPPPNVTVSGSDSICKLTTDPHNLISVNDNATIEGETIIATGVRPAGSDSHTIWLQGSSTLIADNVRTINQTKNSSSSALNIQDNSKAKIQNNLTATNSGSTGDIINISDNSILIVNNNLEIEDDSDRTTNAIKNQDSTIFVDGTINIKRTEKRTSTGNGSIYNQNGEIKAKNIKIDQGTKNFAIQQISSTSGTKQPSINVKEKLEITTGTIDGKSAIQLESGSISVGGQTFINTFTTPDDGNEENSAIYIKNGQYQAGGGALITINTEDDDGPRENTAATGIILGSGGTFTNNGEVKVNGGKNTVIATNTDSEKATVNNTGTIKSNDNVNSIAHNSNGTLTINNEGTIEGIISNKTQGTIKLTNNGQISHGIKNPSGIIDINNNNTISGAIINTANDEANKPTIHININNTKNLSGNIRNEGTGIIKITNTGTVSGDITNAGDRVIDVIDIVGSTKIRNNIEIINNGDLSNIINQGKGNIHLTNKGQNTTVVDKEIKNTDTGNITIENQQGATLPHTFLNQSTYNDSSIEINNSGKIDGDFTNEGSRILVINKETGIIKNNITGNADLPESDISVMGSHISITNHGQLDSTINIKRGGFIFENKGKSQINLTNYSGAPILLMNSGTLTGSVENSVENDSVGEFINFKNYPTGQFTGSLNNKQNGKIQAKNEGIFTGTTQNNKPKGSLNLNNTGTWINNGNSTLSTLQNTGKIEFPQITNDRNNENNYHYITVQGDYTGGGKIIVNTFWNDNGESYSDYINIKGNVSGTPTTVSTHNGIYGDVSRKEISRHSATVIHVDGTTTDEAFRGDAYTPNAVKAELKKIDSDTYGTGTNYAWVLTATPKPDPVPPTPTEPIQPDPADPAKPAPT
ncbi:MAG: hypothetical protein J6578_08090, partial [Snodgrassella sp.]|uniref:ESPR-type extended signal peptide-containing protein n=1 Tax=Snodgrassella sp. TaxID=2815304 RepID=UPI00258DE7D9